MTRTAILAAALLVSTSAFALPAASDRIYTADQNSNTVSVIDPVANKLLGQIRLGNPRPDVLSPLYRGEVNVHGLGFSPDHTTLAYRCGFADHSHFTRVFSCEVGMTPGTGGGSDEADARWRSG